MDYMPQRSITQKCVIWSQTGLETIIVHQVIGEMEAQKAFDICIKVPHQKPAIEQVINVYVNKICITNVEVITNAVIVCGHFDIKVLYVACLPDQPVHAVEKRRVKFSVEVCINGARCGMDADASVALEFVDYDYRQKRAYKHKHEHTKHNNCDICPPCKCSEKDCTREVYVSVVLKIIARVMADREIILSPGTIIKPKG